MATVTLDRLRKVYPDGHVAVHGASFEVADGELLVLVGPSGCGKSTLLRMIAGLEAISDGTLRIDERIVNEVAPKDRDIAMVFQSYALYPHMTVAENLAFGLTLRDMPKAEIAARIEAVADRLELRPLLKRRPAALSGGQRQRVAMGRALVRDPKLFLFDEPLSNLDAKLRVEMRMEIKQLHRRIGTTCVYVTHDQIEAMTMATRIAVMHAGEVQQFADPDTIYNRPSNLFVARFMGAPPMNTLPARLEGSANGVAAVLGHGRPDAIRLTLPDPGEAARAYLDREVVLGIRPECICEADRRLGIAETVSAPVEMTEPTGAETIVLLRLGGVQALGRISPDVRPPIGAESSFAIDTRRACLFDPTTERLIA